MRKILLISVCLIAFGANAQVADTANIIPADTIKGKSTGGLTPAAADTLHKMVPAGRDLSHYVFHRPGTYIVPAALVGYGVLSFAVKPIRNIDYYFQGYVARTAPNYNSKVDDILQLSPAALVYALNLLGDRGQNRFGDRTALLGLSAVILTITDGTKYLGHRNRPYGTDPLSFPSGHTGAAFLAAEFLAQEYSWKSPWYGVVGYGVAATTGILRVYSRAHWFSDCVAGAGLGMLSTKAAYLLYPHVRKIFSSKDKYGRSAMVLPTAVYGAPGLAFNMPL